MSYKKITRYLVLCFNEKKKKVNDFTSKDAYTKLIEVKYKLQHDQEPIIKTSRISKIKFNDIWEEFLKYATVNKKSYLMDELNYNKHIKPIFGNKDVKNLISLDFENFKQTLFNKKLEAQTVKHQLTLIRTIINHAIKHDILNNYSNPLGNGKVKMPSIDNKRVSFLLKDQAKEILEILKSTHELTYHLTVLLLFTGARFSEITGAASKKNKSGEKRKNLFLFVYLHNLLSAIYRVLLFLLRLIVLSNAILH